MRFVSFILTILIAPVLAAIFGAILDQLTYSISAEFFRYSRFPYLPDLPFENERLKAALAGIINSWQFGIGLGVVLSLVGTIHSGHKKMFIYTLSSFFIALGITAIITTMGMFITLNSEFEIPVNLPDYVIDQKHYMAVIMINNYAYAGGIIGVLVGAGWHIIRIKKDYSHKAPVEDL